MTRVFVSYRREDSMAITGRLCDRFRDKFGGEKVFVDIDDIPYGANFVKAIEETLRTCHVVVVVIGDRWLGKRTRGKSRLDNANDFVRMELAIAMSQSKEILPILVGDARMPAPDDLPEEIRDLAYLNAPPLDIGRDFDRDVEKILTVLQNMAARVGFTVTYCTSDIEYKCRRCGYQAWIHKLEWFGYGERPPSTCPKCGGMGYGEEEE